MAAFGDAAARPRYRVACFVSRVDAGTVTAPERTTPGHFIAYVLNGNRWFELNDASVVALPGPPSAYPYIVFLRRLGSRGGGATAPSMG